MRKGEYTRTQALVLASAVEALSLELRRRKWEGADPISILAELHELSKGLSKDVEEGHMETWGVEFMEGGYIMVAVSLKCDRDKETCRWQGHNWVERHVSMIVDRHQDPKRPSLLFRSEIGARLKRWPRFGRRTSSAAA